MLYERIDVHSHIIPPFYRAALEELGIFRPDGMPKIPEWSPDLHLDMMNSSNIKKSIISYSSPGTTLYRDAAKAAGFTRKCNAYSSELKRQNPSRFGFWASLPLPYVRESILEIEAALKEGADGFILLTNARGTYLGSETLDPIIAELNRRKSIIFIHPTSPCIAPESFGSNCTLATPLAELHPIPMYEFLFDTARAVSNLFMSGTINRHPDLTIILPHLGGTFPPLVSRLAGFSSVVPIGVSLNESEVIQQLRSRFFFDLAGFAFAENGHSEDGARGQLRSLVEGLGIEPENLLYGSDFCFTPAPNAIKLAEKLDEGLDKMFDAGVVRKVLLENAEKLLNT